jgi:aspartyl-tRNA(Asn)/glutamyl-tRNA(Gln) amidotransferase subunit A
MDAATSSDLTNLSAQALSQQISARRLSPVDVVDAYLKRIEAKEPKLQAFVEVYGDDARLAAEAAHKAIRAGHAVGPLHGVPIALKDLIDIEGKICTGGCGAWRSRVAPRTATLARHLIAQGMIVLGKTHTVQFAMGGWGTNTQFGTPWNPWDPARKRTPGGSSSGSGVAVAAALAPWAIGSDTGGSVRLPASWCGLTGLKTTVGRISTFGVLPLSTTFDTLGPMCRSVEDAALLYSAMPSPDPNDPRTLQAPPDDPFAQLKRGVRGLRLAAMPQSERQFATPDVLAAYDKSLEALRGLGAEIVAIDMPFAFTELTRAVGRIISPEAYTFLHELVDNSGIPLDEDVRPRVTVGKKTTAREYVEALQLREELKRTFAHAMTGIDALLTPTTTSPALPLEEVDQSGTPAHFTRFGNFLDLCGLALPNGFSAAGLPTSLQIVCRGHDEAMALRIGWAYQDATDWHLRRPPEA